MGHNPIPPPPRSVTEVIHTGTAAEREDICLGRLREAFAHDRLTLDDLEAATTHVLQGGIVDTDGRWGVAVNGQRIEGNVIAKTQPVEIVGHDFQHPVEVLPDAFFDPDPSNHGRA